MEIKDVAEMSIYNPKLKKVLNISQKRKVKFKTSRKILEVLNRDKNESL